MVNSMVCCENCLCSKCDFWKICNDAVYNVENWCDVCNDLDIDHCFTEKCDKIKSTGKHLSHPLQTVLEGKIV